MSKTIAGALAAATAAITLAPSAAADTATDEFLRNLHGHGISSRGGGAGLVANRVAGWGWVAGGAPQVVGAEQGGARGGVAEEAGGFFTTDRVGGLSPRRP